MEKNIDCQINKKINIKNKSLRSRKKSSSDDDERETQSSFSGKIEEMKIIQKSRGRPRGVEIIGGEVSKQITTARDDVKDIDDPFKVKSGGMVNMKNVTVKQQDDAYDVGIGTQFSAETNKRDEDEEMMKYIDDELIKRKNNEALKDKKQEIKYHSPEEAALQAVPEHLRVSSGHRSEEMLSNQMLSGIPEVDLGIECKIKNIEATEEAKLRLLWEQRNKKDGPSQFVPTNMAVNFAQVNKDQYDGRKSRSEKRSFQGTEGNRSSGTKPERATDDLLYERFKKQFRRY